MQLVVNNTMPACDEIEMILQSTRVDMTRLSILMAEVQDYRKHVYNDEVLEVVALLLWIFQREKANVTSNIRTTCSS